MTRQEMFDKAVRGLRSQKFASCVRPNGNCIYNSGDGKHCAWGWVDPEIVDDDISSVDTDVKALAKYQVGVAGTLSLEDIAWATRLQCCHDDAISPDDMQANLRKFAVKHELVYPEA